MDVSNYLSFFRRKQLFNRIFSGIRETKTIKTFCDLAPCLPDREVFRKRERKKGAGENKAPLDFLIFIYFTGICNRI
jgi:hypothetical protein